MKMRISDLVEMIGKKKLAPDTKHLVVEMLVSDAAGEDVDVSTHYFALPLTQLWPFRSHIPWCTSKASSLEKNEMRNLSMSRQSLLGVTFAIVFAFP
jgi:Ubiquitin fold domain